MIRPTYLWTLFLAFQGLVFGLCAFFHVEGAPDDLWLLALAHIPLCMVMSAIEGLAADKPMSHINNCDEDTYFNANFPFNQQELSWAASGSPTPRSMTTTCKRSPSGKNNVLRAS